MKFNFATLAAVLVLGLAACSSGNDVDTDSADADGDGAVSIAEAGEAMQASGAVRPMPGLYRMTSNVMGQDITVETCLTPEMVDGGYEEMMQNNQDGDCSYEKFEMGGGNVDAVMVCNVEGAGEMRMEMQGQVTETSVDMTMKMGDLQFRSKQERIGDCAE
ncbi:MAG: DUF3617 family protein [Erythrobacter sp.]|nr:DUF3617 family protein [Erythrobacter sp.]